MNRVARFFLLLFLTVSAAGAHPILQNPVWIDPCPEGVTLYLDVSVRELIVIQKLPVAADGGFDVLEAEDYAARHPDYVLGHFRVKADHKVLTGKVTQIIPPQLPANFKPELEGPDNARFRFIIHYPFSSPPSVLSFSHTMGREFPSAPGVAWDLSYLYRYGAGPMGSPKAFGSLREGEELSFHTGFSGGTEVAGSLVKRSTPRLWAALWLLFAAAITLGGPLRLGWYQAAALLWMGAWLVAGSYGGTIPLWLMALPGGACVILAAVDNIYSHDTPPHPLRRRILLFTGCVFFAMGLSNDPMSMVYGDRLWPVVMFFSAVVVAAAMLWLKRLAAKRGAKAERFVLQMSSLLVCGAAIWVMLLVLHILTPGGISAAAVLP